MTADVLVIGGGFAGLTAARDLAAAGRSLVVLEARSRLGGRTWLRPFEGTEHDVELGGAWFSLVRQPPLAEEVERYGVSVVSVPDRRRRRWFTGGTRRRGRPVPKAESETLRGHSPRSRRVRGPRGRRTTSPSPSGCASSPFRAQRVTSCSPGRRS